VAIGEILGLAFQWDQLTISLVAGIGVSVMFGMRLYLIFPVFLNLAAAARMFRQLFPVLLVMDAVWAASPLLLFPKIGWLSLVCVVLMAPLPFAQRTLMRRAHPQSRTSVIQGREE